jgi:plasmid stabilization system protein ParE
MAYVVEIHPDALEEAGAAVEWYATRSQEAADAFIAELDRGVKVISESPERWPAHLLETRRYLLRRFPFAVVYRHRSSVVQVVAIAHGKRRPGAGQFNHMHLAGKVIGGGSQRAIRTLAQRGAGAVKLDLLEEL